MFGCAGVCVAQSNRNDDEHFTTVKHTQVFCFVSLPKDVTATLIGKYIKTWSYTT